jgi:hypothetical protein
MSNLSNRRRFRRTWLATPVVCEGLQTTTCVVSRNISQGGMLLQTAVFAPGDEVKLSFMLPNGDVLRRTIGTVMWRDITGCIGIQFVAVGKEREVVTSAAA